MAKDEALIERIRPMLSGRKGVSEQRMFGSTCFLLNGNVCVGHWKGSLVVRLDREHHDETLAEPHTKPFGVPGRVMEGWALVEPAGIESDDELKAWVVRAVEFVGSLPAK